MVSSRSSRAFSNHLWLVPAGFLLLVILIRTAWVADDAYITYRTIDNLLHGYGLTWNVIERVQAYTHPLWMFVVAGLALITHEMYYTPLIACMALSIGAVLVLALGIAGGRLYALVAILLLATSKAFTDYSTSGLENSLTHLILVTFIFLYLKEGAGSPSIGGLSFLACLGMLNRLDTALLFLPGLAFALLQKRRRRNLAAVAVAFLPLAAWEVFSILYYGFPFPNTAYAKLATGIPERELAIQGVHYLLNSISWDPSTLLVIATGLAIPLCTGQRRVVPLAAGLLLYLGYTVMIGGDFMSGRFLAAPFIGAVGILSSHASLAPRKVLATIAVVAVGLAAASPRSPLWSGSNYGDGFTQEQISDWGIVDERAFYFKDTGLLRAPRNGMWPNYVFPAQVGEAENEGTNVLVWSNIGRFAYYAGADWHVIDQFGIADPLLARLPAFYNPDWRIGHFRRVLPEGYLASVKAGNNQLTDSDLAAYYDNLLIITRGKRLLDPKRLGIILSMNLGRYDSLIHLDRYRYPGILRVLAVDVQPPTRNGGATSNHAAQAFPLGGIQVDLGEMSRASSIAVELDCGVPFHVDFINGAIEGSADIHSPSLCTRSSVTYDLRVPARARAHGFSAVRILPTQTKESYALGFLRLTP